MNGGPTASDRGREILRDHGFVPIRTYPNPEAPEGVEDGGLELWTGPRGTVVLHDYGPDGWDLYLQAVPNSTSVAATILALHKWGSP
jgi:hypothetical protein